VTTRFDAIVIGAGQAGPSLAARLAADGRKTAVIERHRFGGTCVNTGCIPTKTLVASARAMHMARRGAEFGFSVGSEVRADMARVKGRMEDVVRQSREGVERWMKDDPNITVYAGHGRFEAPHTVRVGADSIEAEQIFINVGARAFVPDFAAGGEVPFLTNSSLLDLGVLPEHLIVIGGSYVGLELAQVYRRFGSRVTVIEQIGRLIAREDPDVSETLQRVLEEEGIAFHLNASCIGLARARSGVAVSVDCAAGAPRVEGSHVLLAVGRRPNTGDLGLAAAGIATDAKGYIVVDDQCRTSVPGIWAMGECNGRGAFTHTAYNDYEIVSAALFGGAPRRISNRIPCYALYTDPPVGRAGMTTKEARQSGRRVLAGHRPMTKVSRAREMSETRGFMRVLVDAENQQILGAVVFGAGGDEVVHSVLDTMYAKASYETIARAVHIHPTVTELIPTMLQDLTPLE
jgi:pyruvate/2-oxoglutarate dehydrogenase complex dihydrolipoamide dehydrogenase (E3) component